jgi:diguanylate cyclase (GGDEF)-like protein
MALNTSVSAKTTASPPAYPVSEKTLHTLSENPSSTLAASTLHMANALQSTLDLDQLIEIFAVEVHRSVPHAGLEYRNNDDRLLIAHGREARHTTAYDLVVLEKSLGTITFKRDEALLDEEIGRLEALICALVYPLRNALMYRRALETALKDPVTGINNRAALNANIDREVILSQRHGYPLSVIMLDLDHFKRVNDKYGHLAGDAVLRTLAMRITECTRGSDMVFRYGGEEFTVVLSNTDINGAALLAERIRRHIENHHIIIDEVEIPATVSLGVATLEQGDQAASLISRADAALYEAKSAGRNRVMIQTGADVTHV